MFFDSVNSVGSDDLVDQKPRMPDFDFSTRAKIEIVVGSILIAAGAVLCFVPGVGLPVGITLSGLGFLMVLDGVKSAGSDIRKYSAELNNSGDHIRLYREREIDPESKTSTWTRKYL